MKKIIYSKYSNERADQFKIRTDILEDLEGIKFVHKTALTSEAQSHINNIYTNYNLLSKQYKDSKICINKCCKIETGLEFEYVEGRTLTEELDELLFKENYMEIFERIKEYVSIIEAGIEKKSFQLTDDFINVFGKVNLPYSIKAAHINNIDLIFSNIIIGKSWNVIDYEWTFNFPVPFNYIIYRAIRIYIEQSFKRSELADLGLYKLLGITNDEITEYSNMEINFERYVLKNFVPLSKLYGKTIGMNIDLQPIIEQQKLNSFKNTVQVFYDYGKGFNEENSYKICPLPNENGKIILEIDVKPNIKQIRIDPANSESIVNLDSALGYTPQCYDLDYYNNGIKITNKSILFTTDDPQIVVINIKPETFKIQLIFDIRMISTNFVIELSEFIENKENEIQTNKNIIKDKENIIKDKENIIKDKENIIKDNKSVIKDKENIIEDKENIIKDNESVINECNKKIVELRAELKDNIERIQKYNEMSLIKRIRNKI